MIIYFFIVRTHIKNMFTSGIGTVPYVFKNKEVTVPGTGTGTYYERDNETN